MISYNNNSSVVFNISKSLSYSCSIVEDEVPVKALKLGIYSAIMLLSFVGNCLVIAVVMRTTRMQNVTNYLICNMAMTDLLITVFNMPTYLEILITEKYDWPGGSFGLILCKLVLFIQGMSVAASVLTLTAIAADRFVAVMFPQKKKIIKLTFVKFVILAIWFLSVLAISPLLYALTVVEQRGVLICDEKWSPLFDEQTAPKYYTIAIFVFFYATPLAVMAVLYSVILFRILSSRTPGHQLAEKEKRERQRKHRVLIMLVTVVCVFALCWLPMHVRSFLYFFRIESYPCGLPRHLDFIGYFFGHANSAINVGVYAILNENYRRGFMAIYRDLVLCCSFFNKNSTSQRNNLNLTVSLSGTNKVTTS